MKKRVVFLLLIILILTGCNVNAKSNENNKQEIRLEKKSTQLIVGDTYKIELDNKVYFF